MSAAESPAPAVSSRRKLGRGLTSLISAPVRIDATLATQPTPSIRPSTPPLGASSSSAGAAPVPSDHAVQMLEIGQIVPNPKQPRQHFDEQAINMLAGSIKASGLMQPIVVRAANKSATARIGGYQIIAGERRWRAAQIAGLSLIPAIIRSVDDRTAAELSLIENLQREDLNPIERADAFQLLIVDFGLTHQEIADRVSLDRSSVTNHLRLLELDEPTQAAVREGGISMGHAKVLLAITNTTKRAALARQCMTRSWSVRELERHVKSARPQLSAAGDDSATIGPVKGANANTADLVRRLSEHLGTKVHLKTGRNKGSGRLIIEFYDLDQFEGLLRHMRFSTD